MRVVSVRGGMFEAEVHEFGDGGGTPALFLHGETGLVAGPYLDAVAASRRVIAPRLPGYGDSTGLEHLDDIIDLVVHELDLLDALGLAQVDVIGHSLGGMVGAEIAAIAPHRVRRLVLASPLGLWRDDEPTFDFFAERAADIAAATWFDVESGAAKAATSMPAEHDAVVARVYETMQSLAAAAKFSWPIPDKGLRKRIHRITAPTLLLWGERDGIVPNVYAGEFQSLIAGSRMETIAASAHMPHVEQPEAWARAVTSFLDA